MNPILAHALSEEKRLGLPEGTAQTLIKAESGGYTGAKSPKGAIGLTQLMPNTAKELGVDPYNPYENITGGLTYYAQHLNKFKDPTLAAAAYNAGPNNRALKSGNYNLLPKETQNYMKQFGNLIIPTASADETVSNKGQSFQQGQSSTNDGVPMTPEEIDQYINNQPSQVSTNDGVPMTPEEIDQYINGAKNIPERTVLGAVGEGITNIPSSAGNALLNTAQAIIHPVDTLTGIGELQRGIVPAIVSKFSDTYRKNLEEKAAKGNQPAIEQLAGLKAAESMADVYKQRYGGGQEILNTLATDPIGMGLDIQPFMPIAKSGLTGTASKIGKVIGSKTVNPSDISSTIQNTIMERARANPIGATIITNPADLTKTASSIKIEPEQYNLLSEKTAKIKGSEYANRATAGTEKIWNKAADIGEKILHPGRTVLELTSPYIGKAVAMPISLLSGIEQPAIAEAIRAGEKGGLLGKSPEAQAFTQSMRGKVPEIQVVDDAKNALNNIRTQMYDTYNTNMQTVKESTKPIDMQPILDDFEKAKEIKSFKGQEIDKSASAVKKQVQSLLDNWNKLNPADYHTASGLDALKQQLGDLRTTTDPHTPSRAVVDKAYNSVKNQIVKEAPEYGKAMNEYSSSLEEINNIERELSLKEGANPATALRKLQSIMRNNANTSWGARAEMGERLKEAGAPYLGQQLAGQAMSAVLPRGLGRITSIPAAVAAGTLGGLGSAGASLLASSPRAVGELSYGLGKGIGAGKQVYSGIEQIPLRGLLNQLAIQQEQERTK